MGAGMGVEVMDGVEQAIRAVVAAEHVQRFGGFGDEHAAQVAPAVGVRGADVRVHHLDGPVEAAPGAVRALEVLTAQVERFGGFGDGRAAHLAPAVGVRGADVRAQHSDVAVKAALGGPVVVGAADMALEVIVAAVPVELVRRGERALAHLA